MSQYHLNLINEEMKIWKIRNKIIVVSSLFISLGIFVNQIFGFIGIVGILLIFLSPSDEYFAKKIIRKKLKGVSQNG